MTQTMAIIPKNMTEDALIDLWIRGQRSEHTRRAYQRHIALFRQFLQTRELFSLHQATLVELIDFSEALKHSHLSPNSQKVILMAVKSFLSFASKNGVLPVNVGAAIKSPDGAETVSERILSEYEVQSMIKREKTPRNYALLRVLYDGGLRLSEIRTLKWHSVIERGSQVQIGVLGKRNKYRIILLSPDASSALLALGRGNDEDYVFKSRQRHNSRGEEKGDAITPSQILTIVRGAAKRAEIKNWEKISPHWLRHAHGSHAIQHGAPLPLVRDTMGHQSIATTNIYAHARPDESSARYLPSF
jgi:integrase/recombinase XerD